LKRLLNGGIVSFLDIQAFSAAEPDAQRLLDLLVSAYPAEPAIRELIERASIPATDVNFDGPVRDVLLDVLRHAARIGRLRQLVDFAADDPATAAYHPQLQLLLGARIEPSAAAPDNPDFTGSDSLPGQAVPAPPGNIFISYRRNDAAYIATFLFEGLEDRFGRSRLFKDVDSIDLGENFVAKITAAVESCAVLLVVIGARWLDAADERRRRRRRLDDPEDFVRLEIEAALKRDVLVIPVLLEGARMPPPAQLPASLAGLAQRQAMELSPTHFRSDLQKLLTRLDTFLADEQKAREEALQRAREEAERKAQEEEKRKAQEEEKRKAREEEKRKAQEEEKRKAHSVSTTPIVPAPGTSHFATILQHLAEGNLVPFLGSGLGVGHPGPPGGPASSLDADELAADLAERFNMKSARPELPEVAQYVYVTRGERDLYRALRKILTTEYEPGPVHRFLARLPQKLEERSFENRYQLIVSTNFDRALEQAFDDAREAYDLVVYMASGPDKGKFVHFPYDDAPAPIVEPNSYARLPIGDDGELARTVIVKMLGGVDSNISGYRWEANYVITEDQYLDYLSRSPIENLIPVQILDKLYDSHCLFLGYPVRDWGLRVVLKRLWRGEPIGAKSWAIEPSPDAMAKESWAQSHVDVCAADLAHYVDQLDQRLTSHA
jgi:hypothetical protein